MYSTSRLHSLLSILTVALLLVVGAACSGGGDNDPPDPPEPPVDTTAPAAPSGLEGASGDGQIDLSWSAVSASDLEGYNVYRATSSISSVSGQSPINSDPLSGTAFTDDDVENGTTYFYRVTAIDDADNQSDASGEAAVTPFPSPPDRP